MNENNVLIGHFLKQKRLAANLTQKDIADAFELTSTQFISNWERGISLPPSNYLPKLCKLMNIDPKELIKLILQKTEAELNFHFLNNVDENDKKTNFG